jgi:hypothetical protein
LEALYDEISTNIRPQYQSLRALAQFFNSKIRKRSTFDRGWHVRSQGDRMAFYLTDDFCDQTILSDEATCLYLNLGIYQSSNGEPIRLDESWLRARQLLPLQTSFLQLGFWISELYQIDLLNIWHSEEIPARHFLTIRNWPAMAEFKPDLFLVKGGSREMAQV